MSFSMNVKNELCRMENVDNCCFIAELAAVLMISASVSMKPPENAAIRLITENAAFARRLYIKLKKICNITPQIIIRKGYKLKKHVTYTMQIEGANSGTLLGIMGMKVSDCHESAGCELNLTDRVLLKRTCCKKAFLRGAFLAGGSVSDPEKTYHLELTTHSQRMAIKIKKILDSFKLNAKIIRRKGTYVNYIKEGENIVDFFNITGAHTALMELENVRILKDMRNSVNRVVNCETANLEKTVNASLRQAENIKFLLENNIVLPAGLREIAELRLQCSDANLTELGQMLFPALGKSGVNHRLRKLDRIADEEREKRR